MPGAASSMSPQAFGECRRDGSSLRLLATTDNHALGPLVGSMQCDRFADPLSAAGDDNDFSI